MDRRLKVVLTFVVLVGGGGFLVFSSVSNATPYRMVDQLVAGGLVGWDGKQLKVHGFVLTGSLVEAVVDQEVRRTFVLQYNNKRIRVVSHGPKPDTFKDESEVVATGRLVVATETQPQLDALCTRAGPNPGCPARADDEQRLVLIATDLTAKCPHNYNKEAPKLDPNYR